MRKIIGGCALVCLCLMACQSDSTSAVDSQEDAADAVFFPLENYIEQEVARLTTAGVSLEKQILYNDKEEVQTVTEVNYEQELSLFRRADINKPAWIDLYLADTVLQDNLIRAVRYQTQEEELEVKSLEVKWDENGTVNEIVIRRESSSTLASNEYDLIYRPEEGYEITTLQQNRSADPITIRIKGTFQELD